MTEAPRSAYGISLIEYFQRWKRQCEENLRFAESQPGFKLIRRTEQGGDVDVTEEHKQHLRDACDEYQRAIDYLNSR